MKETKNVLMTFTIPQQQREELRKLSSKTGFSIGETLRRIIDEYLEKKKSVKV